MPFLATSLPQDVCFSSVWTVMYVKPRCDNCNRSLCSSCNKVALEAMWKSTNHVIIWFGGWDKDISSPHWFLQYCSGLQLPFSFEHFDQKEYDDWLRVFCFQFSFLKREWYLMGIIILICYIFLIRDLQSIIFSGFVFSFFFLFRFGTGTWTFISDLPERTAN